MAWGTLSFILYSSFFFFSLFALKALTIVKSRYQKRESIAHRWAFTIKGQNVTTVVKYISQFRLLKYEDATGKNFHTEYLTGVETYCDEAKQSGRKQRYRD